MSRLVWNERNFESGVSQGVLYFPDRSALAWNGLTAITETPDGDRIRPLYLDGDKRVAISQPEEFSIKVEAFTYPLILDSRYISTSGMAYTTHLNDRRQIHLVYNPRLTPDERSYSSISDDVESVTFAWLGTTTRVALPGYAPTAHLVIDTPKVKSAFVQDVETMLYGSSTRDPEWFPPNVWVSAFTEMIDNDTLLIIDHGDGLWTAIGPDSMIEMLDDDTFQITSPTAVYLDADTYTVSSM